MARGAPGGNSSKHQVIVNGQSKVLLEQPPEFFLIIHMKFVHGPIRTDLEPPIGDDGPTGQCRHRTHEPLGEQ